MASPEVSKARRRITSSLRSSTAATSPPAQGCRGGVTHREQPSNLRERYNDAADPASEPPTAVVERVSPRYP